ncbi:MAG TPA: ABC transporter ATP-binding protein [Solirubrobacteraceae bacterium]|jgi:ABC-2 type transport system ATP-binding protein|nr:ABC transporter ATP-binding protein [Solirubrobacteraceae bacterium]
MNVRDALFTRPDAETRLSAAGADALMSFDGIWRYWGRGRSRWAVLRGVDLQIPAGAAVRVEGSNGAGKTTLLRIGTAILSPHAGTVTVDGIRSDGNWREFHRRIGFLSAGDRGLYARFSVKGHLEYCARLAFLPRSVRGQVVEDALVRFGLGELAKRRADRLSQGQRQRLRLALTFVHRPRVLLLDEPRNSLDEAGLEMLADAVDDVLGAGGAVLWCAPAGEEQPVRFDRSYVIADGTLQPTDGRAGM